MAIELKSFNQILGDMIRRILAETPLSDINAGSVLLSLLEACASNDFENNVAILNILELLNIDAIRNNDLDARAGDFGLTRLVAQKALGLVTISNTNIVKQSTGLYIIKPAPISSQTTIYVNDTTGWSPTGTLYIGRGTESFEGPIPYTAITVFPTFSKIDLGSALQKDHLSSDTVINSQGQPDRVISAGAIVKIPANNETPDVLYVTLRDAVLSSGEDSVSDVQVIALVPGSQGNALINTITQFDTIPFSGAAVTNTSSFSSGTDIETDTQLRNRIKAYSTTLARGTIPSIISAVQNVSDPVDNKQVVSAVITEPVSIGQPSILYIDDGSGFQPSYAGQSVDVLLSNANGTEQYLQLANFPLPRPQVVNTAIGPYILTDSMFLRIAIDGTEETVIFTISDFVNISSATVAEIVVAINSKSTLFKARLANNSQSILIYPVAFDAEIIQVSPLRSTDIASLYINTILKFPTTKFSYITLYQNSTHLVQKNKAATIETVPFASWNITGPGDLIVSVDGTPAQDGTFNLGDFTGAPSSFAAISLDDWVVAFNKKFAGITTIATPSQTMQLSSNKIGNSSAIIVSGGTYIGQLFSDLSLSAVGQTSQFEINRETGNIKILTNIAVGDTITAGTADAKGFAISSPTLSGSYNVANDAAGRPAEMIILTDSTFCNTVSVTLPTGSTLTITDQGSGVMRIMSSTFGAFSNLEPGYFVYIVSRTSGWLSANNCGIFKLIARGHHLTTGVDTYIEVLNANITPESATVINATDMKGFTTDGYPQIWRGIYTNNPPAATLDDIVTSLNATILGVNASIFRSNSIKLTSITETNGSIAIPISVGNAAALFLETPIAQFGNPSEIANRVSDKSLISSFKRSIPVTTNVWLNRETIKSITGPLSASDIPDVYPFSAPYSEIIQSTGVLTPTNTDYSDIVDFTRGNNKGLFKPIAAEIVTDSVGTQQGIPRTEFDHIIGDEITLMKSLSFAADDNIVFIMDNNPSIETIDIKMARTGKVNSGSNSLAFLPTTTEFSADDADNEPGIDFGNANVWSTSLNHTNFSDYAVLMRARNWYSTGGTAGINGKMIIRSQAYGNDGNLMQFAIKYPQTPNSANTTVLLNSPSSNLLSYFFGSGPDRPTAIPGGTTMSVTGPYPNTSTNFPAGAPSSGNYYDYTFSAGTFTSVQVGDVLSINLGSGVSTFNDGQFGVKAISGNTIRVFNPAASPTSPGAPTVNTITTIADVLGTETNVTINLGSVSPAPGSPNLASAAVFGVLASSTITNTGNSVITGDLGLYPGTSVTGFPPGSVVGSQHVNDSTAQQAEIDALAAYTDLQGRSPGTTESTLDGLTLGPGTYTSGSSMILNVGQTLTLDAGGNPNALWIFQLGSTLTLGNGSTVSIINGGSAANVYWQVGSSATIGTTAVAVGTIIAQASITINHLASLNGRALALTAAVTLDDNAISIPAPVGPIGASLDGSYFIAYDNAGSIKIWFDVDNNGTPEPVSPPTNRKIKISTILSADTASQVAIKIRDYLLNEVAFTGVFAVGPQVIYNLAQNGPAPTPTDGTPPTGFTFVNVPGSPNISLNGKYFIIYDNVGSVAVWYDVGNIGTPEPFAGADRYIRVSTVNPGNNANIVAAATAATVATDFKFSASSLANAITITTLFNAAVASAQAGTSGFGVSTVPGSLTTAELITNAGQVHYFPLTKTTVAEIVTALNAGKILVAAAVGSDSLTIKLATSEEQYAYSGNASALGYGHNPSSPTLRGQINLYDGVNWIKTFENPNPNFTLKTALTLNGVAPLLYSMNAAPNEDATLGEYFKLVPTTIKNVQHQFTQKALSQLPIIADVAVSNAGKNVQIKSKKLGSAGAVEVVGGQANRAKTFIIGESSVATDTSGNYLLMKVPAFPDTLAWGDVVKLENETGVKRLSRLKSTDNIDVTNPSANTFEYNYDYKATNFISSTSFTITDVSASYGRPVGFVWRWTHSGGGATLSDVNPGDLVIAYGSLVTGWAQGNRARISGDARVAGLPIINVNDSANWFDVVNPYGKAMSSTTMGSGTIHIAPTPIIKWNLNHGARAKIINMISVANVVTVTTSNAHFLNSGDSVSIIDSDFIPDGVYSSVTVTSANTFTFAYIGVDFAENTVGASTLKSGVSRTRYRIETIGFNGLTKLSCQDGDSPRFADCGVAVDDYIVLSGSTFNANNNGTYRVLAVDNNSIIYINNNGNNQINTIIPFNNKGLLATWTANNDIVTGIVGTFKNLSLGDWVKKSEDPDSAYLQITGFFPSTPALATQITLGENYSGISAIDAGVAYDQVNNYNKGVYLQSEDDITFYEGDSVTVGDTLFVQNIVDTSWFNINNTGNFTVTQWGTNGTTLKPFLRVINPVGVVQANVNLLANVSGFYIIESATSKFSTYRQIHNSALDDLNTSRRALYLSPASRQYKFSEANQTSITAQGKLGYNTDITIGTDGYLYYTGLLQRVQRIVDGFESDPTNFPGRRAVGGLIEPLPPLIKNIIIAITVTTGEGFNVGDVSNNIKSTIISYIEGLGVGQDVIISEIIAQVMQLKGVVAVTFNNPIPSTERIVIAKNEKATISPNNIGIA